MERKTNVMIVDDEHDFRQLMTIWLESKNYSVITAPDGPTALELLKKEKTDIIFLDLNMPRMDGIETLKNIRKFNKVVPVIIISAYLDKMGKTAAKPYNISGVFYKGEDFEKGLDLLESALRVHKNLKDKAV